MSCIPLYHDERQRKPLNLGGYPPRPPDGAFAPWTPFLPFGKVKFVTMNLRYYPARTQHNWAQFDLHSSAEKFALSLPYSR